MKGLKQQQIKSAVQIGMGKNREQTHTHKKKHISKIYIR